MRKLQENFSGRVKSRQTGNMDESQSIMIRENKSRTSVPDPLYSPLWRGTYLSVELSFLRFTVDPPLLPGRPAFHALSDRRICIDESFYPYSGR